MDTITIPNEIKTEIDDALDNLNSPEKLSESKLLSLSMVVRHMEENPSVLPYQTLKAILTDILELLEKENPDCADILRGRFWEGLSPTNMIAKGRPKQWSEKTFYNYQKKARSEFYSLLWQKEQNCASDFKAYASADESMHLSRKLGENAETTRSAHTNSNLRRVLIFAIFIILAAYSLFLALNKAAPLSPTAIPATPTISPTLTIFSNPTFTPTSVNTASACGETKLTPVVLSGKLLRHQGVSDFTIENTPGILSNTVRRVVIDRTGLWIGYFGMETNGVQHFDKVNLADCDFSTTIPAQNINAMAVAKSGKVWVGTEKNGILSWDGKEWRHYIVRDGLPSNEIFGLTIDDQDNLWAGTWEGVAKFDGTSWSVPYQVQNDTIFNNHVGAIAFDSEKNIWIGHLGDGVSEYRQRDSTWIYYTTQDGLAGNEMRTIVVRPKSGQQPESIWFASVDGGISRFEQGIWTVYRVKDGLPSNNVNDLALDRYNRVWAATDKGVSYFDDKIWKLYDSLATSTIAIGSSCPANTPCPFDDDQVLTGTPGMGFTHSRLPLPDIVIKVTKICFVTAQRERICPSLDTSFDTTLSESIVTATFPKPLEPGEILRFEITVSPQETYQLRENRGDFISNTDDNDFNLFGAWQSIGVKGTVEAGQPYIFTDYDNPFTMPKLPDGVQEKQFVSTWRVWMHTRYVGPFIRLVFTVKDK